MGGGDEPRETLMAIVGLKSSSLPRHVYSEVSPIEFNKIYTWVNVYEFAASATCTFELPICTLSSCKGTWDVHDWVFVLDISFRPQF